VLCLDDPARAKVIDILAGFVGFVNGFIHFIVRSLACLPVLEFIIQRVKRQMPLIIVVGANHFLFPLMERGSFFRHVFSLVSLNAA